MLIVSQRHHDATVAGPVSSWGAAVGGEWVGGPAACRACSPVCGPGRLGSYSSSQRVALNCVEFLLVCFSPAQRSDAPLGPSAFPFLLLKVLWDGRLSRSGAWSDDSHTLSGKLTHVKTTFNSCPNN